MVKKKNENQILLFEEIQDNDTGCIEQKLSKMFNEEIKERFICELSDATKPLYKSLFKRAENCESLFGKDIFNFDYQNCIDLLIEIEPKSVNHVGTLKGQYGKYVDWCIEKGLTDKNYWKLIPVDGTLSKASFKSRYIKDINELTEIINIGLEVRYDKYVPYLLYMGIMGEGCQELTTIRDTDLKIKQGLLNTSRWVYNEIPNKFLELIQTRDSFPETKRRDESSPYLVKPYMNKKLAGLPVNRDYIYRVITKLNDRYYERTGDKKNFTPNTIWYSGLFSSLYRKEKIKNLIRDDFKEVFDIYGKNIDTVTLIEQDYKNYKEIYWGDEI